MQKDRDGRHGAMASGGWSYRTAYFEDFDGKYYEVTISVAESADGKMVYNIGQMKEEASPKVKGSRAISDDGLRGFASSGDSITESGQNVKRQFSYAGEQAKTADIESLKNAQEMEKLGADMESIRKATGWHMGKDGKWRFEIDDSCMEYRRNGDARLMQEEGYRRLDELTRKWADHYEKGGEALTEAESAEMERLQEKYSDRVWEEKYMLRDFLRHDELFEAYPRLNGVSLAFDSLDDGQKGYFDKRSNTIVLSDNLIGSEESTLLHEVQHVIQKLEGFSQGSSPAYWARRDAETGAIKRRLEQERANIFEGLSREEQNKYTRYQELERELERLSDAEDGTEDGERYLRYDRESDELYLELWGKDWFQKLGTLDRKLGSGLGEEYTRLYRNTAGEVEARDTASRRKLTSEQRRETAPDYGNENTVLAEDAGNGYSISETEDGRAVAVVDSDILAHIDTSSWNDTKKAQAKTAAKTALLAFKDGIRVNGIDYKVNKRSRDEYTRSNDTEHTYRAKPDAFADKMRAAANADDIITATTSWARDGSLKHPRTDSFVDFAHGDVLLQAGENQYTARAVVGITDSGEYVFYDVVDMTPASFDTKKERLSTAALDKNDLSAIQENLSSRSITENSGDVKRQYSVSEEKAETQEAEKAKKKAKSFTRDDLPKKAQGYLKRTEGGLANALSNALSAPKYEKSGFMREIAKQISAEYLQTGKVSDETRARLFEEAYEKGIVVDDIDGNGNRLLVALECDVSTDRKPVNVINSLYGLEHPAEWIKNQIESGNELVLYDEKRANAFLQTYGYSASVGDGIHSVKGTADGVVPSTENGRGSLINSSSEGNIADDSENVKRQYSVSEEKAETQEAEKAKKKAKSFTRDDLPKKAQGYLKRTEKTPRKILKKRENSGTKSRLRAYI